MKFSSDKEKEELNELIMNMMPDVCKPSVMAGMRIAEDCFQNGLLKGAVVKSRDIESYISQGNYPVPEATLYGFNQKMDEYLDSKIVLCYIFEGDHFVYVHKDHIDKFHQQISRALKK